MPERLLWTEIIKKYPHCNVGLVNVEYENNSGMIKSAVVKCTDKEVNRDEMIKQAVLENMLVKYTTLDEEVII